MNSNYPAPEKLTTHVAETQYGAKYCYLPENKQPIEPKLRFALLTNDGQLTPGAKIVLGGTLAILAGGLAHFLDSNRSTGLMQLPTGIAKKKSRKR